MTRVTAKILEDKVQQLNDIMGGEFELDNAPIYGGWKLTVRGQHTVRHRVPPKEMLAFLDGMIIMGEVAYKTMVKG